MKLLSVVRRQRTLKNKGVCMSQYIGYLNGSKGEASRLGTKQSGIVSNVNGLDFGVRVSLYHRDGEDKADIFLTGGSHAEESPVFIGTFRADDLHRNIKISITGKGE